MQKLEDDYTKAGEKLDEIISLVDVVAFGLETIYGDDDKVPASCVRRIKEELVQLKKEFLSGAANTQA